MFEYLCTLPHWFYLSMIIFSALTFAIGAIMLTFVNSDAGIIMCCISVWPISMIVFGAVLIAFAVDEVIQRMNINDVKPYVNANNNAEICDEYDVIVDNVNWLNGGEIYKILNEHDLIIDCVQPLPLWDISKRKTLVTRNLTPTKYKISFSNSADKATFLFYWESRKESIYNA